MKVLALVATPRRGGNVDQLVEAALDGAKESGAEVEKVNLFDLNVQRCTACLKCRSAHVCHLTDDVDALFHRLAAADALIVGAPVYWSAPPSVLASLYERLTGYLVDLPSPLSLPKPLLPTGRPVFFVTSCTTPFPLSALLGMTGRTFRAMGSFWRSAGFNVTGHIAETGTWRPGSPAPLMLGKARQAGRRLTRQVRNVHARELRGTLTQVGALIDGLASENDQFWPRESWPPMILDRPLSVGATGGHSLIRYVTETYQPGRLIRFRFLSPRGFTGTHTFDAEQAGPEVVRLRHTIEMRLSGLKAQLMWPLAVRWLHDALVEDALDLAQSKVEGRTLPRRPWSWWVRFLRTVIRQLALARQRRTVSQAA